MAAGMQELSNDLAHEGLAHDAQIRDAHTTSSTGEGGDVKVRVGLSGGEGAVFREGGATVGEGAEEVSDAGGGRRRGRDVGEVVSELRREDLLSYGHAAGEGEGVMGPVGGSSPHSADALGVHGVGGGGEGGGVRSEQEAKVLHRGVRGDKSDIGGGIHTVQGGMGAEDDTFSFGNVEACTGGGTED